MTPRESSASQHLDLLPSAAAAVSRHRNLQQSFVAELEQAQHFNERTSFPCDFTPDRCMHELFEEQAELTPGAIAVEFEGQTVTYAALNARANRLAHFLRRQGVGPEVLVGLYLQRTPEMVMSLLAILKAGGAYVPLDPSHPPAHLRYLLGDARPAVVVTGQGLRADAAEILQGSGARLCPLDRLKFEREPETNPERSATADNLAYVIYTSGTTGYPKGAMIRHQGLANYLAWCRKTYAPAAGSGSPVQSALSFDLTVTSVFPALLAGRTVWLVPDTMGAIALAEILGRVPGFSLVKLTPAHLELLARQVPKEAAAGCTRAFVVGGEALYPEQARFWREHAPNTRILNEYGPTETTVGCCVYEYVDSEQSPTQGVPIGRPIFNTDLYVLNERLEPVSPGTAGELYIGGAGLARGYWERPELTAERFVPHPFAQNGGARLYRTGDRVRYRTDGNLEYLGRLDHQVKIRGFRIEPGEIETALRLHPAVSDAVVMARDDVGEDRQLVGYVVTADGAPLNALRSFLADRLPEHMIPGIVVRLDRLPLTPNGKVDRRALPFPDRGLVVDAVPFVAPRSATEKWLHEVWQDQLGLRSVGIRDSFFDLGGQSLMAVRIFDRIAKELSRSLSPATIFQAPTIEALAAILDQRDWTPSWKCLVPIRPNGSRPPFFCVHGAKAHVLYVELLARYVPDEIPIFGLQSLGLDGKDEPLTSIEDMAEVYLGELRSVQPHGPYYLGGFSLGGIIALEMAQRLLGGGEAVELLGMIDSYCPVRLGCCSRRSGIIERILMPFSYRAERAGLVWRRKGKKKYFLRQAYGLRRIIRTLALRCLGRRSSPAPHELLRRIWELNAAAAYAYRPRPYPGRITLFYAAEVEIAVPDTRPGWGEFAEGGLDVRLVPGNHGTMRGEPHVQVLGEKLATCLMRAYADASQR